MATRRISKSLSAVIAPSGEIIFEYTALDPSGHVANTLAAVEKWKAGAK
jgi:hypothetical protein